MTNPLSSSSAATLNPVSTEQPCILNNRPLEETPQSVKEILEHLGSDSLCREQTKEVLAKLRTIDLTKEGLTSRHWQIYADCRRLNPILGGPENYPTLCIQINDCFQWREKNLLVQRSGVFQRELFDDSSIPVINFDLDEVSETARLDFLSFLVSGKLHTSASEEKVLMELLTLASKYEVAELDQRVSDVLFKYVMNDSNVEKLLEDSLRLQTKYLTVQCIQHIFNSRVLSKATGNHPAVIEIFECLDELRNRKVYLHIWRWSDWIGVRFQRAPTDSDIALYHRLDKYTNLKIF